MIDNDQNQPANRKRIEVGDPNDPNGFLQLKHQYLDWMAVRNYSQRTIGNRNAYLDYFCAWSFERELRHPSQITVPILELYQRYLFYYRKRDGEPLGVQSQKQALVAVRMFFKWLSRKRIIQYNPTADIVMPKQGRPLPKSIFSIKEVEAVLSQPDIETPLGLRDRAMMETFYSTGLRRMEIISLHVSDVDFDRRLVFVREGKGRVDRYVPLGERAEKWIKKYIREARPRLDRNGRCKALFLTRNGKPLSPTRLSDIVRENIEAACISKGGACHMFRHVFATSLIENGVSIHHVQAMMGHVDISTTQIYSHVSIKRLQEEHQKAHPAK